MKINFTDLVTLKQRLLQASAESFRPEIFRIFDEFTDELERKVSSSKNK